MLTLKIFTSWWISLISCWADWMSCSAFITSKSYLKSFLWSTGFPLKMFETCCPLIRSVETCFTFCFLAVWNKSVTVSSGISDVRSSSFKVALVARVACWALWFSSDAFVSDRDCFCYLVWVLLTFLVMVELVAADFGFWALTTSWCKDGWAFTVGVFAFGGDGLVWSALLTTGFTSGLETGLINLVFLFPAEVEFLTLWSLICCFFGTSFLTSIF